MALTLVDWVPLQKWAQYDGTNSADILAFLPDAHDDGDTYPDVSPTIVSETGGVLTIEWDTQWGGPMTLALNEGDWFPIPVQLTNNMTALSTTQMEESRVKLSDLT